MQMHRRSDEGACCISAQEMFGLPSYQSYRNTGRGVHLRVGSFYILKTMLWGIILKCASRFDTGKKPAFISRMEMPAWECCSRLFLDRIEGQVKSFKNHTLCFF